MEEFTIVKKGRFSGDDNQLFKINCNLCNCTFVVKKSSMKFTDGYSYSAVTCPNCEHVNYSNYYTLNPYEENETRSEKELIAENNELKERNKSLATELTRMEYEYSEYMKLLKRNAKVLRWIILILSVVLIAQSYIFNFVFK